MRKITSRRISIKANTYPLHKDLQVLMIEAQGLMFCDMTQGLAEYIESVRGEKLDSNV
jgi:hypothetical protein